MGSLGRFFLSDLSSISLSLFFLFFSLVLFSLLVERWFGAEWSLVEWLDLVGIGRVFRNQKLLDVQISRKRIMSTIVQNDMATTITRPCQPTS